MSNLVRKFSAFLALTVIASCSSKPDKPGETSAESIAEQTPATLADVSIIDDSESSFLQVLLSNAKDVDDAAGRVKVADAKPLNAKVTANVLARMADLKAEASDTVAFAKREKSLPPPKTSETVKGKFPPPSTLTRPDIAANKADAPVKILRSQPEGDVPVAPHVSVTFDQPMVDVTSHADTIKDGVPVEISPLPKGQWRWVGTKTVMYEPEGRRFPMSTEYTVNVPASTKSKAGNPVEAAKTWTFKTPTLEFKNYYPSSGTYGLEQPVFIEFNQEIDPQVIMDFIELRVNGGPEAVGVKVLDPEKVEDEQIQQQVANATKGRFVVVQGREKLPYDSTITVTLKKGAPSAEGPIKLEADRYFNFRTYGPFRVIENRCGWRGCRPFDSFYFRMSNQIDMEKFDVSQVKVEPSFPGMAINQYSNVINITGRKPGRRTYTVTISRELTDEFGQNLVDENEYKFEVGPADPALYSTGGNFTVLDPSSKPQYTVFSTNYDKLRVKAWKVTPDDWGDYLAFQNDWRYYGKREKTPPGKLVRDEVISPEKKPDDLVETAIDLSGITDQAGHGNLVLMITPDVGKGATENELRRQPRIISWVQSTDIALDAFVDSGEFVAWATDLADGKPLAGATVRMKNSKVSAKTDKNGMARFPMTNVRTGRDDALIATLGSDEAFLPENTYGRSSTWHSGPSGDRLAWYVFDDRQMYKPGETVSVKGWFRAVSNDEGGQVRLAAGATEISWTANGPMGNKIAEGKAQTTDLGGFDLAFDLPATPNLGYASLQLTANGDTYSGRGHSHSFQIQEFRTPEFEVTASANEGPHFAGEGATASVEAKYYAGGGLPNADVMWNVTTTSSSFRPPNQEDYTFGSWTPWWVSNSNSGESNTTSFQAKTDATGVHDLALEFGQTAPPRPMTVRAQASVTDVNRQQWAATTNLLVHPSAHYVGMKSDTYFVEKGTPLEFELVVADVEGNVLKDRPVKVRATRVNWAWRNGEYIEEEKDPQTCEFMTGDQPGKCSFETKHGGQYKIIATTVDDKRRPNFTKLTRWVSGGDYPKSRNVEMEKVELIPDSDEYKPGGTAKILVQSPIVPAEAFLTLRRNGMVEERRFRMEESTQTIEVPIKHAHIPNVFVQVDVVGAQPRLGADGKPNTALPKRPAYGSGQLRLSVPPDERVLTVDVTPKEERVSPGAKTSVDVVVKRADGSPANGAEVAVVVVDEAILALSSYSMADPMNVFYPSRGEGVSDYHLRSAVSLVDPASLQSQEGAPGDVERREDSKRRLRKKSKGAKPAPKSAAPAPMEEMPEAEMAADEAGFGAMGDMDASVGGLAMKGEAGGGDGTGPAIAVRSNFTPLAAFAPAVRTNDAGKVTVNVEMPDNLTRYRIMAVAVEKGTHYGTGESNVTARLPLMVRPSPPRFLNFGDKFELPVVLQNQTDQEMTVNVASRATNIEYTGSQGWSVQVPANDRVEVRFPASTQMAGTARFQVAASAGKSSDASEFDLPVWTPATSEAFATYGVIDEGAIAQTVKTPGEVWPQFGQLEVTTSSTAVAELTDAFLYLYDYDYECAEQISSRVVTVAALRDVLSSFKAEGMPSADAVQKSMSRDIEELASRQNYDGGFGLWRRGQTSWPFVSIHAAHALTRAKAKGYEVDDYVMNRAKNYLTQIERHIPGWYSQWTRRHIIAYALYVRDVMGDSDPARARRLIAEAGSLDDLSFEAVGWLLNVMSGDAASSRQLGEIRTYLNNRVTETAGAAHFAAKTTDEDYVIMRSNRVADGIILESLIEDQPKTDLIPKIVRGLLAHRKKGRWSNTQENAFVLLALDTYFNKYENITPDFVARAWLGDQYAGEHAFKGRTTENHQIDIPMTWLVDNAKGESNLLLQKDGKGRMYYRIGMQYAPKDLFLEAADHGFVVERTYSGADNPDDVKQKADGTWEVKAGAKVKIELTMVAPTRRYHVALVDPLPAGFESMNPALAVTGDVPIEASNTGRSNSYGWWWFTRPWYEHQNLRDERTEAFSTLVWGGVHSYTYYARATTPGEFVVPPAKAEEMYSPETFGRSASTKVVVR